MQPSAPPVEKVIHRSTVLKIEPSLENPPVNPGVALETLPGASLPPEIYHQVGMLPINITAVTSKGGGAIPMPNLNFAQIESMLAMVGVPPSVQELIDEQQHGAGSGPISETARKEAAAAARAARQAKRKEEKQRKQRKTSNGATAEVQAAAHTAPIVATATGMAALAPAAAAVGAAAAQPTSSQQPTSSGRGGRKASNDSQDKSELRAIKNRESAARSRAKRVEYTSALEARVEQLKSQNKTLRTEVIQKAAAPPDPHAGKVDGQPLRRTRTMPL